MKHALLFCAALLAAAPVFAQQSPAPTGSGAPIEITASKTVEWLRNQKQYVARENVVVTQGAMQILSDLLTADYRDGAGGGMEIWQITADGNVRIKDATNTAYGDKGVYDVTNGVAVLTGEDLRLISPDQTVTAQDRMEYHSNARLAKAIGQAKVVRAKDTLSADTITAYFRDAQAAPAPAAPAASTANTPDGKPAANPALDGSLDRLEAEGNVVITTPSETLRGAKAVYRADTNTAEITGKVKIERGPNTMEGSRAEVNLATNVSKMFGSGKEGGRVRGVFFPGSEKKKDGAAPAMPAPFTQKPAPAPAAPAPAPPAPLKPAAPAPDSSGAAVQQDDIVAPKE